jgi:plasmid maintenance system antidote protein VapI/Zn-dependent peptidase ImmA (M78 family)
MSINQEFKPDWTSAPGDTITDILREQGLTDIEFARRIGHTLEDTKNLLQGRTTITIGIARQLERVLGASVEFWISRDFQYREDIAKAEKASREWLDELPVEDMIKYGWLKPAPHPSDEAAAYLKFFGVPSVRAWHNAYKNIVQLSAFRTSTSFDSRPAALAAWLRQGEIEAEAIHCSHWDKKQFRESLPYIRSLTLAKDPSHFLPKLQECCAKSGVAVVVVRAPSGCRASGATHFLSPDKALLMLSFRYLSDDQFWFTFFHEAGHLLLHEKKGFFLEGSDGLSTTEEKEANEFAMRTLIPSDYLPDLHSLRANTRDVIRFSMRLGISPGIVVGQLHHLGKIEHNQLNNLRRYYRWGN